MAETEQPFYERIKSLKRRERSGVGADVPVYTPAEWEQMQTERSFIRNEMVEKGRVVYERDAR